MSMGISREANQVHDFDKKIVEAYNGGAIESDGIFVPELSNSVVDGKEAFHESLVSVGNIRFFNHFYSTFLLIHMISSEETIGTSQRRAQL
jgi:hypothetical protein